MISQMAIVRHYFYVFYISAVFVYEKNQLEQFFQLKIYTLYGFRLRIPVKNNLIRQVLPNM